MNRARWLAGLGLLATLGFTGCHQAAPPVPPPPSRSICLVAVGDILMHGDVKASAERHPDGFPGLWQDASALFQGADVAFGNLETPIAPTTGRPGVPFQFNAPQHLASALKSSGFTVLATANNHAYDQGPKGLAETLDHLRQAGLEGVGSGLDRLQAETPRVLERRGVKVAFLAYTDLHNLNLNREPGPWVNTFELASARAAIQAARAKADVVVVSVHWGHEYQRTPSGRQRAFAKAMVGAGCDLVLGHHPHVLQPVEILEAEGRKGVVAYSLGNFISNQDRHYNPATDPVEAGDSRDGMALKIRFERQAEGLPWLPTVDVVPLWTENNFDASGFRRIRVVSLDAAEARLHADLARLGAAIQSPLSQAEERRRQRDLSLIRANLKHLHQRRKRILEEAAPLP